MSLLNVAQCLGLAGALRDLLALLQSEAAAHGDRPWAPGWARKSVLEHAGHLRAHALRVAADPLREDPDSGYPEALHVAARALFIHAIGREHNVKSAMDRLRNHRT